ncbi:MAG: sigma-54-dependent Fis family transcriptional regulator [Candidatus Tectomicrobia bacterium]|uniref:Sigma-54-dependent Fis family transcriptional regulator n=1 Tax=Tectimicrobiota bacterium TaxID=2528274 RepID=A0A932HV80_UNCTE|nr:sigma-54-dependent Fis family transcriptional regulator [Candidatus Tectomicrobia bacterium]
MKNSSYPSRRETIGATERGESPGAVRFPRRVLVVEDDQNLRESLREVLEKMQCKVEAVESGEEALGHLRSQPVELILLDNRLPGRSGIQVLREIREADEDTLVIMMTAFPEIRMAVQAMKEGAYDYIHKPFELEELRILVERALETTNLRNEVIRLRHMSGLRETETTLWGDCPAMRELRDLIQVVSQTPDTTVLVQGESGTGKELVANAIHTLSERCKGPLVKLNCGGVPETLLESELFGHEKGAFTGAGAAKRGLMELADGGTLFLDELDSMSLGIQPKLLRVLEERAFRRVGGIREIPVDVRIVAATNRDLKAMIAKGEFREDLFYRLNVMTVFLPPLRERAGDILTLAHLFLARHSSKLRKEITEISPAAQQILLLYPWPGNVRELANVMERAVILTRGSSILPMHLPIEMQRIDALPEAAGLPADLSETDLSLEAWEEAHIRRVLDLSGRNKSEAARRLGISRSTLLEKLKKAQLPSSFPE